VLSCSGVIDMLTAPVLRRHIETAMGKKPAALIIDLTEVEFLASAGLTVLIETHDQLTPAVAFAVVAEGPVTARPIRLLGLDALMGVYSTVDAAFDSMEPPPAPR
jgi:anti-anti-sigma factor